MNTLGISIYMGAQWLTTIAVVRLGGYTEAGYLSLAMSVTTVFQTIALFNIRNYQASDLHGRFSEGQYLAHRISTCAIAMLLCCGMVFFSSYNFDQMLSILLFMFFRLTEALVDVYHGVDQQRNRLDIVGKSYIFRGVLTLAIFTILMEITGYVSVAVAGMAAASLLVIITYDIPRVGTPVRIKPVFDWKVLRSLTYACCALFINSLVSNSMLAFPKYMLEFLKGPEILGIYSSIATPTMIVSVASNMIISPVVTIMANARYRDDKKEFTKILMIVIVLLVAMGVIFGIMVVFFGSKGLAYLFGEGILPYADLLGPILISTMLLVLSKITFIVLIILRKTRAIMIGSLMGGAASFSLSALFITHWGMEGTNSVTFLSLLLQLGFMIIYCALKRRTLFSEGTLSE